MAILQERLTALIKITDELASQSSHVRNLISRETRLSINEFYETMNDMNASASDLRSLASNLLARLQAIESYTLETNLSSSSIITLTQEREHIRLTSGRNKRARQRALLRKSNYGD